MTLLITAEIPHSTDVLSDVKERNNRGVNNEKTICVDYANPGRFNGRRGACEVAAAA